MAGHADHARVRLAERVVAGQVAHRAALAKAADGGIDDPRVLRLQIVVAQAARLGAPGFERMHEDVGALREPPYDLHARGMIEIDAHAFLVAVVSQKRGRIAGLGSSALPCGSIAARVIADSWTLDLDYRGAEVAEKLGAIRTGNVLREVDCDYSIESVRHSPGATAVCGGRRGFGIRAGARSNYEISLRHFLIASKSGTLRASSSTSL